MFRSSGHFHAVTVDLGKSAFRRFDRRREVIPNAERLGLGAWKRLVKEFGVGKPYREYLLRSISSNQGEHVVLSGNPEAAKALEKFQGGRAANLQESRASPDLL